MGIEALLAGAKGSSGISIRALATQAQVAGSTITRIQAGTVDPSIETLERIFLAAGFELQINAVRLGRSPRPSLCDLFDAWSIQNNQLQLDWTRWRAFLDELALHTELIPEAIYITPPPTGNIIVDALLAAVAEKLADDAGLPRPTWAEQVPKLDTPYHPSVARIVAGRVIPDQLAARGLMIDSTSLWRDLETLRNSQSMNSSSNNL